MLRAPRPGRASGGDVNGTWHLRIADDTAGGLGTLHCWSLSVFPTVCQPGGGKCEQCGGPIVGAIQNSDAVQNNRLTRNGITSNCDTNKPCPGEVSPTEGTIHYDAYTFTNVGPAACVTVTLTAPCNSTSPGDNQLHSAAYLGGYNPASKCASYLADIGNSPFPTGTYSFVVPSNSIIVVIVSETDSGVGCTNYTLNVEGFCCPQWLTIAQVPGNRVRLQWSTSGAAWTLVTTNALQNPPSAFKPLGVEPVVIGGKFTGTNNIALPPTNNFYQLRK